MIGIQSALQIDMSMQNGNTTKSGETRWLLFVMTAPMSIKAE